MPASSPTRAAAACVCAAVLFTAPVAHAQGANWPRQFASTSGAFIVFQPQPEQMTGNMVTARAAFSLRKADTTAATFGVLWFKARVRVDRDSLTVKESGLDVTRVQLPGATELDEQRYEHLVEAEATGWDLSGSFEELRAGLAASAKERSSIENLDHTAPRVLFSTKRALLVVYDGAPQLEPIGGTALKRVANTPYAVVYDSTTAAYWLNGANLWYRATSPLGPWGLADAPPAAIAAVVPPDTSATDRVTGTPPVIITATDPTELVVTDGEPLLEPLVGHELYYVSNTESDVVRDAKTQTVYVLLSGRWYTAHGMDDPWVYVPADELPAVFKDIPADSPKGNLLASVAGTDQADDALADAEIPQTSDIARSATDASVDWDGSPQFDAVAGTDLKYGVNTDAQVVLVDGRYYLCDQGVWYVATSPDGPWLVSDVRPEGLDDVRPDCPIYNLRFVDIYDVTPEMVEVGYLPGYLGYYPCRGTVVYGTGYHYRPWRSRTRYYPRTSTWGFHARFNPWLGRWSFGISYWSGFLRVGMRWQPQSAMHHVWHSPWLGPGGYHRPLLARDFSMVRYRNPSRSRLDPITPINLYSRSENVKRLATPAPRGVKTRTVGEGRRLRLPNDLYAGNDGRVYQRGTDGQWRVNQGRRWLPTPVPAEPALPVVPLHTGGGNPRGDSPRPDQPPIASPGTPAAFPARQPVATPMPAVPVSPAITPQPQFPTTPAPQRPLPVSPAPRPETPTPGAPAPALPEPVRPVPVAPAPVMRVPETPAPRPPAPVLPPSPGPLEREFRARERAGAQAPSVQPASPRPAAAPAARPAPQPAKKEAPQRKER